MRLGGKYILTHLKVTSQVSSLCEVINSGYSGLELFIQYIYPGLNILQIVCRHEDTKYQLRVQ